MERNELVSPNPELTRMILEHFKDNKMGILDGLGQLLSISMILTKEVLKEAGNPTGEILKVINTGTTLEIRNEQTH